MELIGNAIIVRVLVSGPKRL